MVECVVPLSATKTKACKVCHKAFKPFSSTQKVCSQQCAYQYAVTTREAKQAREARRDIVRRKEALKTLGEWTKEAQAAFNAFVRERDYGRPCISCGSFDAQKGLQGGSRDAGHYRSRGSAPHLRFHLDNCHAQCKRCNRELSGNVAEMRKGIALRIGIERLEAIERDDRPRKYKVSELKRIKRIFNKRARLYRKLRERGYAGVTDSGAGTHERL